jgi:pyridoxamine 5'-phosphate oxidase
MDWAKANQASMVFDGLGMLVEQAAAAFNLVKISGTVERVSTMESIKYFSSRPKESQLGAWASAQSSRLSSRQVLLSEFRAMKRKFNKGEVPLPDFWGGYRIVPTTIEFWQGRGTGRHCF